MKVTEGRTFDFDREGKDGISLYDSRVVVGGQRFRLGDLLEFLIGEYKKNGGKGL